MKLELSQKLSQQQILAPQMILSMDILLLAVQELEQRIEKEFTENPALEIAESLAPEKPAPGSEVATAAESSADLFKKLDSFQGQEGAASNYDSSPRRKSSDHGDERLDILQNTDKPGARVKVRGDRPIAKQRQTRLRPSASPGWRVFRRHPGGYN